MRANEIIYAIYFFENYCKKSKFNLKRKEGKTKCTEYVLCTTTSHRHYCISFIFHQVVSMG